MFCVIYRMRVPAEQEQRFIKCWRELTRLIRRQRGGLGSRLHRDSDGSFLAYAQWPTREAWVAGRAAEESAEMSAAREAMAETGVEIGVLHELVLVEDMMA